MTEEEVKRRVYCVDCGYDKITHLDKTGTLCKYCWNLEHRQDLTKVDLTYLQKVMPI